MVRATAICAVLAGCGGTKPVPAAEQRAAGSAVATAAPPAAAEVGAWVPGPRLPGGVTPVTYDLTLELDPASASFAGHVAITIAIAAPVTQLWLHAVDLEIAHARLRAGDRDEELAMLDGGAASQLRGFGLPHPVGGPAEPTVTLEIDYTGHAYDLSGRSGKEEQGLFREQAGGRWYLFSQAESVFARRIVPCFDEPRWKPSWHVTAIVPADQVVLANAPQSGERSLPDGRREVRFAEIAALPSYLLAVAVGPFELIDAGTLGRGRIPVRFAVAHGDSGRIAGAQRELPGIVDELERYLDAPLPVAKLDVVAVPQFFGAMENPGLITVDRFLLVGGLGFDKIAAHELAHQWFGNLVTSAWWDHLWLSEAFATWLGERVTASSRWSLGPERQHDARARAFAADDAIDAVPLVHPIATSDDVEAAFDAIAYEKGAGVLAAFESFVGTRAFRAAVRAYLTGHAGASVTSAAFIDALGAATSPEIGAAFAAQLAHVGTPVVELTLRCDPTATLVAAARGDVTVPVCVRFPTSAGGATTARTCLLVGARTEHRLPTAGCPAWLVSNDGESGYYHTVWRGRRPFAPLAALSIPERLGRGDDVAAAVQHGDLPIADALVELAALAGADDLDAALAALMIARAIDPLVGDRLHATWVAWLAGWFADPLARAIAAGRSSLVGYYARDQITELAPDAAGPATLAAARAAIDRRGDLRVPMMELRIAAAHDTGALFDRNVAAAAAATDDRVRGFRLEELGELSAVVAPRIVDLVLDQRFAADAWPALVRLLGRSATRTAAWHAVHGRLAGVLAALTADHAGDLIAATASLCEASARAEVAADFTPRLATITGGRRALDRALAAIDRCIARRAALGDLAAALAAAPRRPGNPSTPKP